MRACVRACVHARARACVCVCVCARVCVHLLKQQMSFNQLSDMFGPALDNGGSFRPIGFRRYCNESEILGPEKEFVYK